MFLRLTLTIIGFILIITIQHTEQQDSTGQIDTLTDTRTTVAVATATVPTVYTSPTTYQLSINDKMKAMKSNNISNSSAISSKVVIAPPNKIFHEYLHCRQLSSINKKPSPYSCPYDYEENIHVCWDATYNGTYASKVIQYDHGQNNFYDSVRYGIENCTLQRFCENNGSWAMTISPEIQCKTCVGDGQPVKFNSISIIIETISLSLSLISLTIAVLCMMNVKYVSLVYVHFFSHEYSDIYRCPYPAPPPNPRHFIVYQNMPLLCRCLSKFRRLHLPRNLLHMHLFVAFILRCIVKLVFIHLIIGGYTLPMTTYTRDKCGNIEILSKSSHPFHVFGCRLLSSLFWYTDAISQTFVFCEAMFLFTALTSHLFRDRGCLPFVLWGWLSPLVWLTMWVASHVITDRLKQRTTCWLEADHTTYFYYFFYVPYAFYILVNFGIFLFLVRLLYSKYQSNNVQTNRSGNRHLIKSILILIPLFGLHSLLVMWVFYRKNQGNTIGYYVTVIFKAVFGDLQGFFTSLIYFYFNTEIRHEVLRQVQRTLMINDQLRRSSAGDTLSTRLSTFRMSLSRQRPSNSNRSERRRATSPYASPIAAPSSLANEAWWRKLVALICPCLINISFADKRRRQQNKQQQHQRQLVEHNHQVETSPLTTPALDDDGGVVGSVSAPLIQIRHSKGAAIDNDGQTCDTLIMRNDDELLSDELLTDENDVTIQHSSFHAEQPSISSYQTPLPTPRIIMNRIRFNSTGHILTDTSSHHIDDRKSLR